MIKNIKITKGQKVVLKTVGNLARSGSKIIDATITKVGTKYFYVVKDSDKLGREPIKFDIKTLYESTNYSANYQIYGSRDELEDIMESNRLLELIRDNIGSFGKRDIPLDTLKQITNLLNINTEK